MSKTVVGLSLLSDLTPPSIERTWLTAPHPRLPIVATCSSDKTVRIYSLTNFKLLSTISGGHKRSVRTCAWKPHVQGESVLATGSFDATVGVWRRWDNYGKEQNGANDTLGFESSANGDLDFPDAGQREIDDDVDEDEEWRFAVLLDGHDSEVKSVSWSPSGMLLATCSRDKSIWVWEDLDDGDNNFETVAVMQEHEGDVKCVAWHPVEECLASASYDDTIRMWREDVDDWTQVACIKGHKGTVWFIDWEAVGNVPSPSFPALLSTGTASSSLDQWKEQNAVSGPRLASCSDDRTVRIWRRQPKEHYKRQSSGIPSIIRPTGIEETWEEQAVLPPVHDLSIYAVAWSKRTGLLASVGADGRIVVYEERFVPKATTTTTTTTTTATTTSPADNRNQGGEEGQGEKEEKNVEVMDTDPPTTASVSTDATPLNQISSSFPSEDVQTEWFIVASLHGGHGIYEINHVAWAKRADRGRQEGEEEEVLITTADDGSVKVWTITYHSD